MVANVFMRRSVLVVVTVLVAVSIKNLGVNAECCGRTAIMWAADTCWPFENDYYMQKGNEGDLLSSMMLPTRCIAKVCGDGRVHKGLYCGVGSCNVFGCNCDGGCIKGNALENFKQLNDIQDAGDGFTIGDPTTWHHRS